jgi:hypothetical protein
MKNYYYKHGLIEFPRENNFTPWKEYKDGFDNRVELYYHPYQFVPIRHLTMGNNTTLSAKFVEDVHDQDIQNYLKQWKDRIAKDILVSQNASKKWLRKIGLLMLLQEAYGFYIGSLYITDKTRKSADFYKKWRRWRLNKFQPEQIQKKSRMSIDDIKRWYEELASLGTLMILFQIGLLYCS